MKIRQLKKCHPCFQKLISDTVLIARFITTFNLKHIYSNLLWRNFASIEKKFILVKKKVFLSDSVLNANTSPVLALFINADRKAYFYIKRGAMGFASFFTSLHQVHSD